MPVLSANTLQEFAFSPNSDAAKAGSSLLWQSSVVPFNPQMEQVMRENRLASRFPLSCEVDLDPGTGLTRNLSTSGVCFITDKFFEPDLMLRCFIPMQKKGKNLIRLRCEGRVVRVRKMENNSGEWEIALHFTTLDW
jgi:hypothetical protein